MGGLRLLPGEKEELHLHPAASSFLARRLWAVGLVLLGGLLWAAFKAPWWAGHRPSDWTAAWTWLWGTDAAAYLWTAAGIVAGGVATRLPRVPPVRLALSGSAALAVCVAAALLPLPATVALPLACMLAALPALAWLEAQRLGTHYHVTTHRLVLRTTLPRPAQQSVHYMDLVDLDTLPSPWPDTGTLVPVVRSTATGTPPLAAPRLHGVRPLRRVLALVEALAQRATASDAQRSEPRLESQVAEALAALHRV